MAIRKINSRSIGDTGVATADIADGSITTAKIAVDAVTAAKIASSVNLGRRNIIINGEMNVAQRGTSLTGVTDNTLIVDRWLMRNGGSAGFNAEQSTDAPAGHKNSLKITSTGAHTVGAGNYIFVSQKIEHNNMWFLNYGTSDAVQQTLSFWVKSSKTGTHSVTLRNDAQSRSYGMTYTISSANTWEQKTLSWTSDTTGTWATGTSNGLEIMWNLGSGSSSTTTSNDVWLAAGYLKANGAVDIVDTNSATFQITGVQLEVGDTATPFEHISYTEELEMCRRYFNYFPDKGVTGGGASAIPCWTGNTVGGSSRVFLSGPRMRARPSVTFVGTEADSSSTPVIGTDGTVGVYITSFLGSGGSLSVVLGETTADPSFRISFSVAGTTAGGAAGFYFYTAPDVGPEDSGWCGAKLDAEL